jgi:putative chitinase
MEITADILKAIAPGSKKTNYKYLAGLSLWMNNWFPKFDIDTKPEVCHILAQLAHESDSFNAMEEYASGQAYEGRKDLGNIKPGDGIKFKGHGPLQVTGRRNHQLMGVKAGAPMKFIDNPKLLATPEWGVWSACVFWTDRGLLTISNMTDTDKIPYKNRTEDGGSEIIMVSPIEYISRRVNGGVNGLSERIKFYERAKQVIG